MSAPVQAANDPSMLAHAATRDPVGMRSFITARERAIDRISEEIREEEGRIVECNEAISDLALAIDEGKRTLQAHVETLANLVAIQSRSIRRDQMQVTQTDNRSRSEALQRLRTRVANPISGGFAPIGDQISAQKKEVEDIKHDIGELEADLDRWSYLHELSSQVVAYLNTLKSKEANSLGRGRSNNVTRRTRTLPPRTLRAIDKVPSRVWSKIFKLTAEEEYWKYIGEHNQRGLRPLVYVLSHVCRSWRSAVYDHPALWEVVYVPPTELGPTVRDILAMSLQKVRKPIILLTNLSHHFRIPVPQYPAVEKSIMFSGRPYTLHLFASSEKVHPSSGLPFRSPTNLILTYTGVQEDTFFGCFNSLIGSSARSLTIVTLNSTQTQPTRNANKIANLSKKIKLGMFPMLTSLKLRHQDSTSNEIWRGWESLSGLLESIPGLCTLGVLESAIPRHPNSVAKNVTSLILYESRYGWQTTGQRAWQLGVIDFPSLRNLEFQGGRDVEQGQSGTVAEFLGSRTLVTPALLSITLKNSHIDGERLISIVTSATRPSWFAQQWPLLKELTLSDTSGITRKQCDTLRTLVTTLNIYVN